ncbi:MAG: LCP family protein [Eubacteriales bacterium]|nr:LCP family protein [Eubacteriales bacterium]
MKKNTFDMTKVRVKGEDARNIKETIRANEDPAFTRAAEEYERMARQRIYGEYNDDIDIKGRARRAAEDVRDAAENAGRRLRQDAREVRHKQAAHRLPRAERAPHRSFSEAARQYEAFKEDPYRQGDDWGYGHARQETGNAPGGFDYGGEYEDSYPAGGDGGRGGRRGRGRGRGRRRRFNVGKVIRNILILLLILFLIFVGVFFHMTSSLDRVETQKDDFAIEDSVAKDLKGYRNIAILGLDARADESYDGSRTDAIIILSIKRSSGKIHMISVMRDSYLKMADANGSLILDKITHAHHYGGGVDTCAALNRSLDLNISEFMIFNWKAVADLVDALDGIEVDVKKNEIRDLNKWGPETAENCGGTWTRITKTGRQTINGVQATTYCRIRKTSGGDTGRGNRYKKVVSAVMKKIVTHPAKLAKVSSDVFPKIRTNMNKLQLLTAVLNAPRYRFDKSISWPKDYYGGLLSNGIWYAVPTTLSSDVSWLHKKAFDEGSYTPSGTCEDISNEIIYNTGLQ